MNFFLILYVLSNTGKKKTLSNLNLILILWKILKIIVKN